MKCQTKGCKEKGEYEFKFAETTGEIGHFCLEHISQWLEGLTKEHLQEAYERDWIDWETKKKLQSVMRKVKT